MISPLTEPPSFVSPEEHASLTSSTPGSFVDIPPVLRWGDEADISMTPSTGGWENWPARVHGKVYVTEDAVAFLPSTSSSGSGSTAGVLGFSLPYPSLTLHALVPSSSEGPAHVYCQIDESDAAPRIHLGPAAAAHATGANGTNGLGEANGHAPSGEEEEEEEAQGGEEYSAMREVRIYVPQEKLEPLFAALSACSALHENTVFPGQEGDGGFGFFPSMPEGEGDGEWITADNVDDIDIDEEEEEGEGEGEGEGGEGGRDGENLDPVQRFMSLVDWGNVPRPEGWEEAGQYDDAPKE